MNMLRAGTVSVRLHDTEQAYTTITETVPDGHFLLLSHQALPSNTYFVCTWRRTPGHEHERVDIIVGHRDAAATHRVVVVVNYVVVQP